MPKPKNPPDAYQSKKHKFYCEESTVEALMALCKIERRSRSEVITRLIKAYLRSKAKKLRAIGYHIPQEVFMR